MLFIWPPVQAMIRKNTLRKMARIFLTVITSFYLISVLDAVFIKNVP
jgi:hypothetical protein